MTELPNELIARIIRNLRDDDFDEERCFIPPFGSVALYDAALVSKTWNEITEPLLYEYIDLRDHGVRKFSIILESLLARPKRQQFVRAFHMAPSQLDFLFRGGQSADVCVASDALYTYMRAMFDRFTFSDPLKGEIIKSIEGRTKGRSEEAKVALFGCICPNIQYLHIDPGSTVSPEWSLMIRALRECRRSGASPAATLPLLRLQHLSLRGQGSPTFASSLGWVLELPTLVSFKCERVFFDAAGLAAISSPATTVEMKDLNRVQNYDIDAVLAIFPAVKTLSLDWQDDGGERRYGQRYTQDRYEQMGDALRAQGTSLSTLSITVFRADHTLAQVGSLSTLTALRRLTMPLVFFIGRTEVGAGPLQATERIVQEHLIDILPLQLEELTIEECGDQYLEGPDPLLEALDLQILELFADSRFACLHTVATIRTKPFFGDLEHTGWSLVETRHAKMGPGRVHCKLHQTFKRTVSEGRGQNYSCWRSLVGAGVRCADDLLRRCEQEPMWREAFVFGP